MLNIKRDKTMLNKLNTVYVCFPLEAAEKQLVQSIIL